MGGRHAPTGYPAPGPTTARPFPCHGLVPWYLFLLVIVWAPPSGRRHHLKNIAVYIPPLAIYRYTATPFSCTGIWAVGTLLRGYPAPGPPFKPVYMLTLLLIYRYTGPLVHRYMGGRHPLTGRPAPGPLPKLVQPLLSRTPVYGRPARSYGAIRLSVHYLKWPSRAPVYGQPARSYGAIRPLVR